MEGEGPRGNSFRPLCVTGAKETVRQKMEKIGMNCEKNKKKVSERKKQKGGEEALSLAWFARALRHYKPRDQSLNVHDREMQKL